MDLKYESGVFRTSACCSISCDSQLISSCCEKRMRRRKNERPNEVRKLTEGCSVDVVDCNATSMPFMDRSLLLDSCFFENTSRVSRILHMSTSRSRCRRVSFKFKLPLPIASHVNVCSARKAQMVKGSHALFD